MSAMAGAPRDAPPRAPGDGAEPATRPTPSTEDAAAPLFEDMTGRGRAAWRPGGLSLAAWRDILMRVQHRIGRDVTRSGIFAALHRPGVHNVDLTAPAADIVIDNVTAALCTAVTLTDGGVDE